jgi:Zn-dependent peptidase ImmA (M78 family)
MKKWPALPKKVRGLGGMIEIRLVDSIEPIDGRPLEAVWHTELRVIEILKSLSPRQCWFALYHELAHAAWQDSGLVHFLEANPQAEEAFCDVVANSRLVEIEG